MIIWIIAQLHLWFAAFVLGVPLFAVTVEFIGLRAGDPKYDRLAREFTKLLVYAFSTTATLGAILLFLLVGLYPKVMNYLTEIFGPTMYLYAFLFFGEAFSMYLYYYGWDRWNLAGKVPRWAAVISTLGIALWIGMLVKIIVGSSLPTALDLGLLIAGLAVPLVVLFPYSRKAFHVYLGVMLNFFGTVLMIIANSWLTFMMSPRGVDVDTGQLLNLWEAISNFTWIPINIHRFIANIVLGGAIAGAYAAFRFLGAKTEEQRAHYDWMGYTGNFIAIIALLPLPFAGYWLGREIYAYSPQMGTMMMGGVLSWLWIIQALLIGVIFIGANYYLWLGLSRIPGGERYLRYVPAVEAILFISVAIWMTPHTLVASLAEARKIGSAFHPLLGIFGVMSAKMTVVHLIILVTFISFIIYRRGNKVATASWARIGKIAQVAIILIATGVILFLGVYGYFVTAIVRIGFSVYMVIAVLGAIVLVTAIDLPLFRKAQSLGEVRWGKMPVRSQYVLIMLAATFVILMGLMGYIRSAVRLNFHVDGMAFMQDTTPYAFTPTVGFATTVIAISSLIFFALVAFIFWLGELGEKKAGASFVEPAPEAGLAPAGPGSPSVGPGPGQPGAVGVDAEASLNPEAAQTKGSET